MVLKHGSGFKAGLSWFKQQNKFHDGLDGFGNIWTNQLMTSLDELETSYHVPEHC